ncbi:unnamed protein product [Linum trigynum]|uniref:DUF4283 domain-containing protein n=1 Tax=Linum trigynum TaxID=586398 RepID=A0AAV2E185_9ROSI
MEAELRLLQFLFEDEKDRDWVIHQTPWHIKDRILQLQSWEAVTPAMVESLGSAPFWVNIWGIPSHCRTVAFGRRMPEAKLGEVLDAGLFGINGMSGHFVKVMVNINLLEPLRSQLFASNPTVG